MKPSSLLNWYGGMGVCIGIAIAQIFFNISEGNNLLAICNAATIVIGYVAFRGFRKQLKEALTYRNEN